MIKIQIVNLFLLLVLFITNSAFADELSPCWYNDINSLDLIRKDSCIDYEIKTKQITINKDVIASAMYDKKNLASLFCDYGIFYFNSSGKVRKTINYDNGPDYFQSGLARTQEEGKIGFINKNLDIIIKPIYDFAFAFKSDYALVCNECKKKPDGEHSYLVGGTWAVINKKGILVVPFSTSRSSVESACQKLLQKK